MEIQMSLPPVQTKREIESALAAAGVRPRKRYGQNFLVDGNLMRRLAESAEIEMDDFVLEVGAGTGGLTDLLVARAGRVAAVEIDRMLASILDGRFGNNPHVSLFRGDILEGKHRIRDDVAALIRRAASVKLVANLPYQVATPLLMNLIVEHPQVQRYCFTVQAEVGARISASAGTKAYGPLSVVCQTLCRVETLARLGPQVFWPRPQVDSVMMRMVVGESRFDKPHDLPAFVAFVRGTFDHRRKTLRSALGYVLEADSRDRLCQHVDGRRRPESLSVSEWLELFRVLGHR